MANIGNIFKQKIFNYTKWSRYSGNTRSRLNREFIFIIEDKTKYHAKIPIAVKNPEPESFQNFWS
jgi:hypothetical protein